MDKIKIIPAVLAKNDLELQNQLNQLTPLCGEIYIDYVDGNFVSGKTIDWQNMLDIPMGFLENQFSLHIMANDALEIANEASEAGFKIITLHVEALKEDNIEFIDELAMKAQIFLAIKPETKVEVLKPFLDIIYGVTIMTVKPGAQGRGFIAKALAKIDEIKSLGFGGELEVDGGVNIDSIDSVIKAGATRLVVGSALTKAKNPQEIYDKLNERILSGQSKITRN